MSVLYSQIDEDLQGALVVLVNILQAPVDDNQQQLLCGYLRGFCFDESSSSLLKNQFENLPHR